MPLKDILQKHSKGQGPSSRDYNDYNSNVEIAPTQEFKFIRSDTHTQEVLTPGAINITAANLRSPLTEDTESSSTTPRRRSFFRRRSHASAENLSLPPHHGGGETLAATTTGKGEKRISNLLHLDHHSSHRSSLSRSGSSSSVNIPADLPQIDHNAGADEQDREAQWEKRATRLVQGNPRLGGVSPDRTVQSARSSTVNFSYLQPNPSQGGRSRSNSGVSEPQADVCTLRWSIIIQVTG